MSDQNKTLATSEMADQFIAIANELSKTQTKDRVGIAFMFAAARYNAFVSTPLFGTSALGRRTAATRRLGDE